MDGAHIFGVACWHPDSARTFLVELPFPLLAGAPLLDPAGASLGTVVKAWRTIEGRWSARIRLAPDTLRQRPTLRADLLAHRVNLRIDGAGRLLLAPRIDPASLPAAPMQRHPLWLAGLRVVASR